MLALNETLQNAGEPASIRFNRVRYSPLGAISALLTKKADATELLITGTNILMEAAKTVDPAVIGAETLERWHWLKGTWNAFGKIPRGRKTELFRRKVESSTRIQLKTSPQWLIHET